MPINMPINMASCGKINEVYVNQKVVYKRHMGRLDNLWYDVVTVRHGGQWLRCGQRVH